MAPKLRLAGQARVEHRDTGRKGILGEEHSAGRGPELGRTEHGWGQHIGLVGEQRKSRKVMGGKMGRIGSPGLKRALNACLRMWQAMGASDISAEDKMCCFCKLNQTAMHRMRWDCTLNDLQESGRENTCVMKVT